MPVAYHDAAEMAAVLASAEPTLFFTQTDYDGRWFTTAVLTPTALIVNSAVLPENIRHTEVALRLPVSDIVEVSLRKAGLYDRLVGRVSPDYLVVAMRGGRTRSFYFHEKEKAAAMHAVLSRLVAVAQPQGTA